MEYEHRRKRTKVIVDQQLNDLRQLFQYLPATLPIPVISTYDFGELTQQELEDYGNEPSALVHRLESELGHLSPESKTRLQLKERGPGAAAVVDFLEKYYRKHPSDVLIQRWIQGLLVYVKEISEAEVDDSETNDLGVKARHISTSSSSF